MLASEASEAAKPYHTAQAGVVKGRFVKDSVKSGYHRGIPGGRKVRNLIFRAAAALMLAQTFSHSAKQQLSPYRNAVCRLGSLLDSRRLYLRLQSYK